MIFEYQLTIPETAPSPTISFSELGPPRPVELPYSADTRELSLEYHVEIPEAENLIASKGVLGFESSRADTRGIS